MRCIRLSRASQSDRYPEGRRNSPMAIRLWEEYGETQTEAMRQFSALPNPYEPGYRHSAALEMVQRGPITDESVATVVTLGSTGLEDWVRLNLAAAVHSDASIGSPKIGYYPA